MDCNKNSLTRENAQRTTHLAIDYFNQNEYCVVGVDLRGNPTVIITPTESLLIGNSICLL